MFNSEFLLLITNNNKNLFMQYNLYLIEKLNYINIINFNKLSINYFFIFNLIIFLYITVVLIIVSQLALNTNLKILNFFTIFNLQSVQFFDIIILVFLFLFFNLLLLFFHLFINNYLIWSVLLSIFFFFIQPVFIFPIFYLFFFGMNFLLYISLINKKSLLRLFFDDLLILIAFVVRFFGQFIRIFLILSAFFLAGEYLNTELLLLTSNFFYNISYSSNLNIIFVLRLLFEVIHCWFIFSLQLSLLFIVLVWLFSSFFTVKLSNIFEK